MMPAVALLKFSNDPIAAELAFGEFSHHQGLFEREMVEGAGMP
jgi:hypothetical protein